MARQPEHDPLLHAEDSPPKRGWISLAAIACLLFVALVVAAAISLIPGHASLSHSSGLSNGDNTVFEDAVVHSQRGVVASDDRRCSEIGVSMLRMGGHAADAAIATALCQGVICQTSSGIGGGDFIVVHNASTGRTVAINSRETAPAAASENMYENNPQAKTRGPLSVAVPGEIAGMHEAWSKYGRLPWRTLFEPSINLSRYGFAISQFAGRSLINHEKFIMSDPGLRQVYAPKGTILKVGEICYNRELANTLEQIAIHGPNVFYHGIIGKKLISDLVRGGGIITLDDLKNYKVRVTDAVTVNSMGYTIYGMPPPSGGTVGIAMILNIFESYLKQGEQNPAEGPLGLHRLVEALKHMFAIRPQLGDPSFVDITEPMSKMLSPAYAKMIRERILDNTTFPSDYYRPKWSQSREHGTTHMSVVDEERNVVSLTATVNHGLGSGLLLPSTGIVINNQMDDFSTPIEGSPDMPPPSPANFIRPGKRPMSSMTPIIIFKDKQLVGVLGGSGGLTITPGVAQVFINHFFQGMKPLQSVKSPRVYHRLIPNIVWYEDWIVYNGEHIKLSKERRAFLQKRGHDLEPQGSGAICNSVFHNVTNNMLTAVSDLRKAGFPAGL